MIPKHLTLGTAIALAFTVSACGDTTEVDSDQLGSGPGIGMDDASSLSAVTDKNASFVTLNGVVTETLPAGFTMRHGAAIVRVEMDDWDAFPEAGLIKLGDAVVVRGLVDRDLWERNKIEASSVYLKSLDAYLYASAVDEEDFPLLTSAAMTATSSDEAVGYVTGIEGREFTIGAADRAVRVDTARMTDNPLDETGSLRVKVGDRVFAYGSLDFDATEKTELMAEGVVRLVRPGATTSASRPRPSAVRSPDTSPDKSPEAGSATVSPSNAPSSPPSPLSTSANGK